MTKKTRIGWYNLPGLEPIETLDLVAKIRRYRGRKTYEEILRDLGVPSTRGYWLTIRNLCKKYEIITKDIDDPDYFPSTIHCETEVDMAREHLKKEIKAAVAEWTIAQPFKRGDLKW